MSPEFSLAKPPYIYNVLLIATEIGSAVIHRSFELKSHG